MKSFQFKQRFITAFFLLNSLQLFAFSLPGFNVPAYYSITESSYSTSACMPVNTKADIQLSQKTSGEKDFCTSLKKIITESGNGFADVKYDKKEEEDIMFGTTISYKTKLPKLGFNKIKIVEEEAMRNNKSGIKTIYTCMFTSDFKNYEDAEAKFNNLITSITDCISLKGELTKSATGQLYSVDISENGLIKRINLNVSKKSKESSLTMEIFYSSK